MFECVNLIVTTGILTDFRVESETKYGNNSPKLHEESQRTTKIDSLKLN